jgi:hypothetical protein
MAIEYRVEGIDPFGCLLRIDIRQLMRKAVEDHPSMMALRGPVTAR